MRHTLDIDKERTGKRIQALVTESGISVTALLDYLGLSSPNSIYKWYHGKALPNLEHSFKLSHLCGISIEEMIVRRS